MNKKDIINILLPHYKFVLESIEPMDFRESYKFCQKNHVLYGMCVATKELISPSVAINDTDWMDSKSGSLYRFPIARYAIMKEQIVTALVNRINFLTDEYAN